jgi:3-oxoacyl-(acyl-carrier-protein) synthase
VKRRVVVTGMGVVCPLGSDLDGIEEALRANRTGVRRMDEWAAVKHMLTRIGAPADVPEIAKLPRKVGRLMGRVALLATVATKQAIAEARLSPEELASGKVGLAHGSTHGSSSANEQWVKKLLEQQGLLGLPGTAYLKFMSHTTAANLSLYFGIRGRMMTTCAACVSASHAVGYAYEAIRAGTIDAMVCGGAEELHFSHAGVFDVMQATSSRYNERPEESPRPSRLRHVDRARARRDGTGGRRDRRPARACARARSDPDPPCQSIELSGKGLEIATLTVRETNGDVSTTRFSDVDVAKHYSPREVEQLFRVPPSRD